MRKFALRICASAAVMGLLLAGAPAAAEDEEEKIGLAAGLGLTAATGKTTIAKAAAPSRPLSSPPTPFAKPAG